MSPAPLVRPARRPILFVAFVLLSAVHGTIGRTAGAPAESAGSVSFSRDVQPILAEHCYHCHGPDEGDRKGKLRLDQRDAALRGGKSALPGIVPGRPDESEVLLRILSDDEEEVMPPLKEKKPLSAAQKNLLRTWIAEGAPYAAHWAFVPPAKPALPSDVGDPGHPVDALVDRVRSRAGLVASPPADPAVLARRLHLDLIGLPPTPAAVDAFTARARSDLAGAVASLADSLLADERFGERWARVWLDAARYADSNGYEKDLPREQWAWRDWVIQAFNRDYPYDRFLVEQIAGDLLPDATPEQIIATGFLRNGMVNEEGAIVPEQFRIEGVFDRLDCIGKSVLGLTLQCAQCHTHKFDPISHDEYFGTFAFFNNAYEAQSWVYTADQRAAVDKVIADLRRVDERSREAFPDWEARVTGWAASLQERRARWTPLLATELASTSGLNHPVQRPDGTLLNLGHPTTKGDIFIVATPELAGVTGLQLEALTHRDLEFGGPGRSKYGTWAITELEVSARVPGAETWEKLALRHATADYAEPLRGLEAEWDAEFDKERRRVVGPVDFLIDGSDNTAWRADRGPGRRNVPSVAVVQFAEPLTLPAGTRLRVLLRMQHGGDDNGRHNTMVGCCRISLTTDPDPRAPPVDHGVMLALARPAADWTAAEREAVFRAWRSQLPEAKELNAEAATVWGKYPKARTSVLHLAERSGPDHRTTRLLDRGGWDQPKHEVSPGVPAALNPWPAEAPRDRLGFARWLTAPDAPLTARVAVNRVWQTLFGQALVETPEDFGTRSPVPAHLELLDWLAVDFVEGGWSHKHLLRRIVTSRTYQQDSRATPMQRERDPANRLLARGPRFRADAEVVRDIALAVSGLLHHQVGGPSVFPPVPENVLAFNFTRPTYWNVPTDAQRYRRSLYLFRKRSMPDPALSAFDAPNGDTACVRRVRSNTPLAALTSLNEPIFVEAAQALAVRLWREGGPSDTARVDYAYRLCTGRPARPEEVRTVLELLGESRDRLRRGELPAGEIAFSRLARPTELPADATPSDLAAWAIVARVLLNLDETLSKS